MPNVTAFNRIQFACADLDQSVSEYQYLFGSEPGWRGEVSVGEETVSAAWFYLQNTVLELLCLPEKKPGLWGLVLECEQDSLQGVQLESEASRSLPITLQSRQLTLDHAPGESQLQDMWSAIAAIPRVDHLVLYTSDADDCIRLFGDLGMRLALDQTVPEWGGRMVFFRCGKLTLEIIEPGKGLKGADYFWGIAYQAEDIEAVCARLSEATLSAVRDGRKPGTRVATLKSHHLGIPTLLVQQLPR
ncbi:VOC family protein [Pseudomaricurvus alkylphenolicus]|uniref:VOC family protein n=1 Tax=Pseudomaricurvus alkylphenolicus TaxID=1306991 RepID=UPI00141E1F6E|nr:VOC family protein [Pseudomaricurvus alkylphenolicus]NIB43961.1 VOC family protein [Pseudomaricurvus alkylphenolicus]